MMISLKVFILNNNLNTEQDVFFEHLISHLVELKGKGKVKAMIDEDSSMLRFYVIEEINSFCNKYSEKNPKFNKEFDMENIQQMKKEVEINDFILKFKLKTDFDPDFLRKYFKEKVDKERHSFDLPNNFFTNKENTFIDSNVDNTSDINNINIQDVFNDLNIQDIFNDLEEEMDEEKKYILNILRKYISGEISIEELKENLYNVNPQMANKIKILRRDFLSPNINNDSKKRIIKNVVSSIENKKFNKAPSPSPSPSPLPFMPL